MKYNGLNILLILACLIFSIYFLLTKDKNETYTVQTYIVQAGDTAWKIMSENNSGDKDIRELIYYIEKDNNIKAGYLKIGQEIKIRIYEKR